MTDFFLWVNCAFEGAETCRFDKYSEKHNMHERSFFKSQNIVKTTWKS